MRSFLVSALVLLFTSSVSYAAIELPYSSQHTTQYNDEQSASTLVAVDQQGVVNVNSHFANTKRLDGDHFTAIITFWGEGNSVIAVVKQVRGLNARGFGGTQEATEVTTGNIPIDLLSQVQRVTIEHGFYDKVSDAAVWNAVGQALQAFLQSTESGFRLGS